MNRQRFEIKEGYKEHIIENNHPRIPHLFVSTQEVINRLNELYEENKQLKSENKRLADKLNKTALELVDECISQGKATEISEMSYEEFLDYRAKNGKSMELQL